MYTPLFAIARVPGWCAHRVEEVEYANRIIRPAYKYLGEPQEYLPLDCLLYTSLNRLIFLSGMFVPRSTTMIHYSFLTQRFFQAKNASRPGPTVRREAF